MHCDMQFTYGLLNSRHIPLPKHDLASIMLFRTTINTSNVCWSIFNNAFPFWHTLCVFSITCMRNIEWNLTQCATICNSWKLRLVELLSWCRQQRFKSPYRALCSCSINVTNDPHHTSLFQDLLQVLVHSYTVALCPYIYIYTL